MQVSPLSFVAGLASSMAALISQAKESTVGDRCRLLHYGKWFMMFLVYFSQHCIHFLQGSIFQWSCLLLRFPTLLAIYLLMLCVYCHQQPLLLVGNYSFIACWPPALPPVGVASHRNVSCVGEEIN